MTPAEMKALEATADTAKNLISKLLGPVADQYGALWADNAKVRVFKNQIKVYKKVLKIAEAEGLKIKQVNLKAIVPLLEGIGLEEDETLQRMWANLFLNYIDADINLVTHVYPSVLKQLSSEEVEILIKMKAHHNLITAVDRYVLAGKSPTVVFSDQIGNLERLGIITGQPEFKSEFRSDHRMGGEPVPKPPAIKQLPTKHFIISNFGHMFLEACSREK